MEQKGVHREPSEFSNKRLCTGGFPGTFHKLMRKKERKDGQGGSASGQGKTHVVGSNI